MKRLLKKSRALAACAPALLLSVWLTPGFAALPQDKPKEQPKEQTKISPDEEKAVQKINAATSTAEKTKLTAEFLKKFKKTALRGKLSDYLSGQIAIEKDPNVKAQAAQQFMSMFDQPGEAELVKPALIDAYVLQGKFDEAYSEGEKYLATHPDDVFIYSQLGFSGAQQVQKNGKTWKHTANAAKYAAKAVEMLEGDQKPAKANPQDWTNYRNAWLPRIYQATGLIYFYTEDRAKSKEYLEKSFGLDPYEVSTLAMLGNIANDEYTELAKRYQTERKSEILEKALERMDELIDWYARGVAASDGKPEMREMRGQILEQLQEFYKFRHDGKLDGLDALLAKYKKPAQ